jgi:hypothetical protein
MFPGARFGTSPVEEEKADGEDEASKCNHETTVREEEMATKKKWRILKKMT